MGGRRPGGIADAADLVVEHRGAIEYELMTRTRYTLDDIGGALSWSALFSFISNLPAANALVEDREMRAWLDGSMNAWLLADIIDAIQAWATRGKAKPIPRPNTKQKSTRRLGGAEPIPASDFDAWWNNS